MRTRKTGPDDIPALKALWKEAFPEDTAADIDAFFETLYPHAFGFCAEEDGAVVSMLFALPQTIVKEEMQLKAAYFYAVATREDMRGRGCCRTLMAYAEKELHKRYIEAVLLCPATQKLAAFYETLGYSRQGGMRKEALACAQPSGQAKEIGVQDYAGLRETLLWDVPHVRYDRAQLEYAADGGKFYCLMTPYGMGCAQVCRTADGQNACVREILPSAGDLPALAGQLGSGTYEVCRSLGTQNGQTWAMLKWLNEPYVDFEPVYMGFAFD